ncbi:MAG: hypothetical protein IT423_02480 [Pirellulaceae bacterium]|nr:hypothetical protein [Pirellulaceae bacterium]
MTCLPLCGQELQAGAAKRIITPDPLIPISGGLGPTAPANSKRGELMARAMVLRQGNTTVAFLALDLLGFPSVLADRVRAQVPQIPADNILIGSTHTHSAPDCYAFPDGQGGHTGDLKYIDFVCQQAAQAIQAAYAELEPAHMKSATGQAEGRIAYNYYAPDLYDRGLAVLQLADSSGSVIGTLVNYAVHPEVLGAGQGIVSPDLIGPLCDKLEKDAGGIAIFFNGAQGGMVTADNRDLDRPQDSVRGYWHDKRTWDECIRIGETLASESLRLIQSAQTQTGPALRCQSVNITFPVDNDTLWQVIQASPLKYPHNADRTIQSRVNLVTIGDTQMLTIPGEALPNIGFYLKRKMHSPNKMLLGLTNDAFGYILTEVDFNSFKRYEYISRTSLGEKTGTLLIDASLKLMK